MVIEEFIICIFLYYYIYVLDQNSNVFCVEVGLKIYIWQDNERVLFVFMCMVIVFLCYYCIVVNFVFWDVQGLVLFDVIG